MFTVTLYKFKKKPNSTARPGSALSRSFSCYALDNSSIIRPTLILQYGTDDILRYNYAYIPSWGRYYFIDDVAVLEGGIYQLVLNVDVLATYRPDILSSSQYVLRSASNYNANIVDDLYTTTAEYTATSATAGSVIDSDGGAAVPGYFTNRFDQGYFVMSVISDNGSGVTYYNLTYTQFRTVLHALMNYVPADMEDVSDGVAKSLFDPVQYITGCTWFPVDVHASWGTVVNSISFGGYSITIGGGVKRLGTVRGKHFYTTITLPKHPQASGRPYTQLAPYSQYTLIFEPFGSIPIDTSKLYGQTSLRLDWYIDTYTGEAELLVKNGSGDLITAMSADVGVSVPVSQLTVDYIGGASSVIGGVIGTIANAIGGNIGGAINSAVSGIGSAVQSALPQVQTKGASGSFVSYIMGAPVLHAFFTDQVDIDPVRYGRPLCEVKTLSTLSGFALCSESSITIEGTQEENTLITGYLNSGVYLE